MGNTPAKATVVPGVYQCKPLVDGLSVGLDLDTIHDSGTFDLVVETIGRLPPTPTSPAGPAASLIRRISPPPFGACTTRPKKRALFPTKSSGSLADEPRSPSHLPLERPRFGRDEVLVLRKPPLLYQIRRMTGLDTFRVIYSMDTNALLAREFNACVCGARNVMLLLVTEGGETFGAFLRAVVEFPERAQHVQAAAPGAFFLFELGGAGLRRYARRAPGTSSLVVFPNADAANVCGCSSAFWVQTDGRVYFHDFVRANYEMAPHAHNAFARPFERSAALRACVAVEWV